MGEPIPRGPFDQGLFLTHYNKGRELFEARHFEEAERQLEEAYLLRPRDQRVLNLLGLVYYRGEKLAKAEEVYRKLVAESPEAQTLHYNLGLVCFKLGKLDEAEASFLKALELTPGNPKLHFYLGSIYERQQRLKDAIYQYRQAGAHILVQRLEGRMGGKSARPTEPAAFAESDERRPDPGSDTRPPVKSALAGELLRERKVEPVSPALMAGDSPPAEVHATRRLQYDDTLPPGARSARADAAPASRESFRALERGLMEIEFAGKVFIKQGTIYSYSGKLTFWVKDKRAGARAPLVIVTGTGRLILTDQERELTFMQVTEEPVFVEPSHLLACEEGLQPRYVRVGDDPGGLEMVELEGRGMLALSVASKPLPLTVKPGVPVAVPTPSVIMWTGALVPHVVDDPEVYAVVLARASAPGRMVRLEGSGRVLVEQATH